MLCCKLVEQDFDLVQVLIEPVHMLLKVGCRQAQLFTGRLPRTLGILREYIHGKRPGLQEWPEGGTWVFARQD